MFFSTKMPLKFDYSTIKFFFLNIVNIHGCQIFSSSLMVSTQNHLALWRCFALANNSYFLQKMQSYSFHSLAIHTKIVRNQVQRNV